MNNKKKNKFLVLIILLLGITIGYAALSTTLKINGTANVSKNTWNVYWDNPEVTEGSVTTNVPVIGEDQNDSENTKVTWTTTLNVPGDFYEFTVDAVNGGTIDAMITNIEQTITPELPNYVKFTVTYADGSAVNSRNLLRKKKSGTSTREKYRFRVEFLDTVTVDQINAVPEGGLVYTITYDVTYSQATSAGAIANDCSAYLPLSTGNTTYGYTKTFNKNEWVGDSVNNITANDMLVVNDIYDQKTTFYKTPTTLPENYYFSGRFTASIIEDSNQSPMGNYMAYFISSALDNRDHSITIMLDVSQSSGGKWRGADGAPVEGAVDGWNYDDEPYAAEVEISFNKKDGWSYAVAEYLPLLDSGAVHEVWYNYDGKEKRLYVYIADYDTNGNVTKPSQPIVSAPIDLEEIFEGEHTVYSGFYGQTDIWNIANFHSYGFELVPKTPKYCN